MESTATKIQEIVKKLFDEEKIDVFIGHEKGTVPLKSRPLFIWAQDEDREQKIGKITWDSFCSNNVAVFLPKQYEIDPRRRKKDDQPKPRIALSVKGCDLRSVINLIRELQVPRDHLVLIGVPCAGMVDRRKVQERFGDEEIVSISEEKPGTLGGPITVTTKSGKRESIDREEFLRDACIECRFPMPEGTDYTLEGEAREPGDGGYDRIKEFEKMSVEERWARFEEEMEKCIRCNACRQACPTCYCKECFAEERDLNWIGATTELSDTMLFHIIRVFHQAGRCVECDACYDACPENVDLRMFTKKMVMDVEELFDYVPDFVIDKTPPLSAFAEGDSEEFITDPDKK